MPYAFGFHPYFAVPDKASASVVKLLEYVEPKEIAREWVEISWIDADTV